MPLVFMWFMLVKRAKKKTLKKFIGNIGIRILYHKVLIQKY